MSTSKFVVFEGGKSSGTGGSGPEDPMIERIEKLEGKMDKVEGKLSSIELTLVEIKATLAQMPKMSDYASLKGDFGTLKADVARIEGRLSNLPTWWMLMLALLATWGAGAGIVYALT
jgi:hypothetical protein